MSGKLFRQEALEAQREPFYGEIVVAPPLTVSLLTLTALAMVMVLGGWLYWGEYTRKVSVAGFLAPTEGLIRVYPPQGGRVVEQAVTEGQRVAQGEVLLVISSEHGSRNTPAAQSEIIARLEERRDSLVRERDQQRRMDQIQLDNQQRRLEDLGRQRRQLALEEATQARRIAAARERVQRLTEPARQGFVPRLQLDEARERLLDQQLSGQRLQREGSALEQQIGELERELPTLELQAESRRSALGREIAALEQQLTEHRSRRDTVITAPREGVVTTLLTQPGQTVTPGTLLLSLLPQDSQLQAQLLVPSRAAGFIREGQEVALRYQAFPYQRFGSPRGRIGAITRTLLLPGETPLPVTLDEPVYRVDVTLEAATLEAYGETLPLRPGMLLEADIHLERRRLLAWLLEPLLSIGGRL